VEVNYKEIEHKLGGYLVEIQTELKRLEFDLELYDRAQECRDLIVKKRYRVAVMGVMKRGKSTLINALLRSVILPAGATPATATINRITYGKEPRVVVEFKDGRDDKKIGIHELVNYVAKLTKDGEKLAASVKEAVVYYPSGIVREDIDIIDTPGLDDDEDMTKITLGMLDKVDAVIMPIHAKFQFDKKEREFVCRLISEEGIDNVVFVVTFMDLVDLDEDGYTYDTFLDFIKKRIQHDVRKELKTCGAKEVIIAKADKLLDDINICGISTKLALKSFESKDGQQLLKDSKFEKFEARLHTATKSDPVENAFNKTIGSIRHIVSEFEPQNRKRLDYFERRAQELESCRTMASEYASGAAHFLKNVFTGDCGELAGLINGDDYMKLIIDTFIKELSTIKEDTHACIFAAMKKAETRVTQAIEKKQKKETHKPVYDTVKALSEKLVDYRKRGVESVFEVLRISDAPSGLSEADLLVFVETVLNNVNFEWSVSPVPNVNDLTKLNPIDAVNRAARVSVEYYKRTLNGAITVIQKNWLDRFDEDAKSILNTISREVEKQEKELADEKVTYKDNYRIFHKRAKAILDECKSIRLESS